MQLYNDNLLKRFIIFDKPSDYFKKDRLSKGINELAMLKKKFVEVPVLGLLGEYSPDIVKELTEVYGDTFRVVDKHEESKA